MKKIIIIAAAVVLLVGVIFAGTGYALGGETVIYYTEGGLVFGETQGSYVSEILSGEVVNLEIDVDVSERISVKRGEEFSVRYNEKYMEFSNDGDTVKLTQVNDVKIMLFGIGSWNIQNHTLEITVPEEVTLQDIKISASAGIVEVGEISAESLSVNSHLGDINLNNITADSVTTLMSTGAVNIREIEANMLSIGSSLGDVKVDDARIGSFAADLSTGSMDAKNIEITQKGELELSLGELSLELKGDRADYEVEAVVDLGTMSIEGDEIPTPTVAGDGEVPIEIEVNTGDINVEFNE